MDEEKYIPSSSDIEKKKQERIVYPSKNTTKRIILNITICAIFIGLNAVATMVFTVFLPFSFGFFNIGESMVYLTAILFGPYIGAISAGVGAMLADIFLTYTYYAPGTLVIKGLEALIVGFVYQKLVQISEKKDKPSKWKEILVVLVTSLSIAAIILIIGFLFYIEEDAEVSGFKYLYMFTTDFTQTLWIIVAGLSFVTIFLIYLFVDSRISHKIIAMFTGGIFMIIGYVLYATLFLGYATAYLEMPFNLMQVCVGITIAVPISAPIKDTLKL
jgi:uncharacterized membrane protein